MKLKVNDIFIALNINFPREEKKKAKTKPKTHNTPKQKTSKPHTNNNTPRQKTTPNPRTSPVKQQQTFSKHQFLLSQLLLALLYLTMR